ncbi:hypothetical protein C1Y63_08850 [Corynebacterium sp. 13CS0277]|uniref:condensation domain-containing protein n=1 Tax=Corynebacterium sp. 13CS0277 TaxID=2071994 RepID=UPI000D02DEB1|nr:condensation domain-containing protein [Corynebacterium sp. 13CS0277]PRQ10963.1 hypothetical protein C1Y63_08850 [Corynebacterium sp. 13CS0277]
MTLPLTGAQRGIVSAQLLDPTSPYYVVGEVLHIAGEVECGALAAALVGVQEDYEALRIRLQHDDRGEYVQQVGPVAHPAPQVIDLRGEAEPEVTAHALVDALRAEFASTARELVDRPLCRYEILQLPGQTWVVQLYHHVIVDGYSAVMLTKRVQDRYNHLCAGTPLPPLPAATMADVVNLDEAYEAGPQATADAEFWREELLRLPADDRRARWNAVRERAATAGAGSTWTTTVEFAAEEFGALRSHAVELGATWVDVMYALVAAYMRRVQALQSAAADTAAPGDDDLVVLAVPVMARPESALKVTPIMAVNVVPLVLQINPQDTLREVVATTAARFRALGPHTRLRGESLPRLVPERPVADYLHGAGVNLKAFDLPFRFGDAAARLRNVAGGPPEDYGVVITPAPGGGVRLGLETDPERVPPVLAESRLCTLVSFLRAFVQDSTCTVDDVDLHSGHAPAGSADAQGAADAGVCAVLDGRSTSPAGSVEEALRDWDAAVARLVAGRAGTLVDPTPGAPAQRWDPVALGQAVERAAEVFRAACPRASMVGLAMPRGVELAAAILACLRAGRCFVVLDPDLPAGRRAAIMGDAQPALVVDELPQAPLSSGGPVRDASAAGEDAPAELAYLVYTSGSTGTPKAVEVTRVGLASLWAAHRQGLFRQPTAPAVVAHTASFTFDASMDQLLWVLDGHDVVVYGQQFMADADLLVEACAADGVSVMDGAPSLIAALCDAGLLRVPSLEVVVCGGEALPQPLWDTLAAAAVDPQHPVAAFNMYGPSEATVDALCARVTPGTPTVGWPVPGMDVYIVDSAGRCVPDGEPGELLLAGPQLARGYRHREEETAARFITVSCDPRRPGQRAYRTGDLGRCIPGRGVEFLGRLDRQVQLAGQRVELGEVESVVAATPGVAAAACVLVGRTIVACVVPAASATATSAGEAARHVEEAVRRHVEDALPVRARPRVLVCEELPLLPSGKRDLRAVQRRAEEMLAQPTPAADSTAEAATAAPTAVLPEGWQECASIIADVLGCTRAAVTPELSLQEIGGDSIAALTIATRCRARGVAITPKALLGGRPLGDIVAAAGQPVPTSSAGVPVGRTSAGTSSALREGDALAGVLPFGVAPPGGVAATQFAASGDMAGWTGYAFVEDFDLPGPRHLEQVHQAAEWVMSTVDALRMVVSDSDSVAAVFPDAGPGPLRVLVPRQPLVASARCVVVSDDVTADELCARLAPAAGVLWQLGVDLTRGRCVLAVHHMAVDAVSWPLVREAVRAALAGSVAQLPQGQLRPALVARARASAPPLRRSGAVHTIREDLPADLFACAVDVAGDRRAGLADVVIATAAMAARRLLPPEAETWAVAVEHHGRDDVSAAGVAGWMTQEHHLGLLGELTEGTPARAVARVRHARRNPTPSDASSRRIVVNVLPPQAGGGFRVVHPPQRAATEELTINVRTGARPSVEIHAAASVSAAADDFVSAWAHAAEDYIAARLRGERVSIPADVGAVDMTVDELAALEQQGPVRAVVPMTAAQQGLVFHALSAGEDDNYVVAVGIRLRGALTPTRVRRALEALLRRHSMMGARVSLTAGAEPVFVIAEAPLWQWQDIDARAVPEALAERLAARVREDAGRRRIDIEHGPLMAVTCVQLPSVDGEEVMELVMGTHHVLTDGWSSGIVLRDLVALLHGDAVGVAPQLPPAGDPARCAEYCRTPAPGAAATWRQLLPNAAGAWRVDRRAPAPPQSDDVPVEEVLEAVRVDAAAAASRARELGTTPSALVQLAWALTLRGAGLQGQPVSFGLTVNGRPAAVPEAMETVGMMISTVPVQLSAAQLAPEVTIAEAVRTLSEMAALRAEVEHTSYPEIAAAVGVPDITGLLSSAVVYENYPQPELVTPTVRVVGIAAEGRTHFPMTVVCPPADDLQVVLAYHPRRVAGDFARACAESLGRVVEALCRPDMTTLGQLSQELDPVLTGWRQPADTPAAAPHSAMEPAEMNADMPAATPREGAGASVDLIAAVMAAALGREHLDTAADFFASGGSSLAAVSVLAGLRKAGVTVDMKDILAAPSPRALAARLGAPQQALWEAVTLASGQRGARPVWCVPGIDGEAGAFVHLVPYVTCPVRAVQLGSAEACAAVRDESALADGIVDTMLASQPEGPYRLLGYSYGGGLAHRVAGLLQARGHAVDLLGILDAYPAGKHPGVMDVARLVAHAPEYAAAIEFFAAHPVAASTYEGDVVLVEATPAEFAHDAGWDPAGAWRQEPGIGQVRTQRLDLDHLELVRAHGWAQVIDVLRGCGALDDALVKEAPTS